MALAIGGAGLRGDGGSALGKPFDLLQLDAVPRGVANDGVETAAGPEHGGKGGPPVEKRFARGQRAGTGHQVIRRQGG
jgi:hypothetical protein